MNLHRYVGSRHTTLDHLGIDERLGVGVLNRYRKHQGTATAVLCHLAGRVGVTLHKGHQTRRGEGRVLDGRTFGADVRQVVTHATATFHQLHLLFVDFDNAAVRVGGAIEPDNKTVGERPHLIVVADTTHGASLRHDVAERFHQIEQLLRRKRVRILLLDTSNFIGDTPVHIVGSLLIDIPIRIFQSIFVYPHAGSQLISLEILQRRLIGLVISINSWFHETNVFLLR